MSRFSDFLRRAKNTSCSVVVVAAGASTRMGEDKLFMDLAGKPVLARTLAALNTCDCVDEIVVVTRLESLEKVAALCREYRIHKVEKVVVGGATRTESALAGLVQIRRSAKYVLIHDGARPLVTEDIVRDALHGAALYKCAAPAVPVTDTVKEADHNTVVRTLDQRSCSHPDAAGVRSGDHQGSAHARHSGKEGIYRRLCGGGGNGTEGASYQRLERKYQNHRTGRSSDGSGDSASPRRISRCVLDRGMMFTV